MTIEIKIPSPGESITEVEIASWLVENGDFVEKDQEIAEIESDKATLPLIAEESGIIKILVQTGETIAVGSVACTIDRKNEGKESLAEGIASKTTVIKEQKTEDSSSGNKPPDIKKSDSSSAETPGKNALTTEKPVEDNYGKIKISPLAKNLMQDKGFTVEDVIRGLKRITKKDVALVAGIDDHKSNSTYKTEELSRKTTRKRMSMLRRKLGQRLITVKNETAMLTTFNEVDMSNIIDIRTNYQSRFVEKHGVKLGFMSFFTKAVTEALKQFPNVNSFIDGEDVVTPEYCDIGIAVQTDKGLMVPVIRNADILKLADIEKKILELAEKARRNRISIEDITGGTFTITNGGIFGSLLSTPILNPPQSGILGMHNIAERPVAIKGKVEIRPMMYLALSYDHRIIDGRDSVGFLVMVKEILEEPVKLLFRGVNQQNLLLDL